jgi:hypothetical protein
MTRRIIWRFEDGARSALGLADADRILDAGDTPIAWLSESTTVRSWHPLGSTSEEILAWRACVRRRGITQPFAQADREVYVVRDTAPGVVADDRFAGHAIRQRQLAAVCRERGWRYSLQGDWDSDNRPFRALPRWDLHVAFSVTARPDQGTSGVYTHVVAGDVVFFRDFIHAVPLADVPPMAFSEAMRDVALFVTTGRSSDS